MKNLYLIIGRSGSGKSTIVNKLQDFFGYKAVESYTTRKPRYIGEKGHTFITKEEFDKKKMLAYTYFDGHEYGVDSELLKDADLYIIDIEGLKKLNKTYLDKKLISICIKCDKNTLVDRMIKRGDNKDMIEQRLINDDIMFKEEDYYPFDFTIYSTNNIYNDICLINKFIEASENGGINTF